MVGLHSHDHEFVWRDRNFLMGFFGVDEKNYYRSYGKYMVPTVKLTENQIVLESCADARRQRQLCLIVSTSASSSPLFA